MPISVEAPAGAAMTWPAWSWEEASRWRPRTPIRRRRRKRRSTGTQPSDFGGPRITFASELVPSKEQFSQFVCSGPLVSQCRPSLSTTKLKVRMRVISTLTSTCCRFPLSFDTFLSIYEYSKMTFSDFKICSSQPTIRNSIWRRI